MEAAVLPAVSDLDVESKLTEHFRAPWPLQRSLLGASSRPPCLAELHQQAGLSLWTPHRGEDPWDNMGLFCPLVAVWSYCTHMLSFFCCGCMNYISKVILLFNRNTLKGPVRCSEVFL